MGRGLETTRSTSPGELLLVSQHLAAVSHPADVINFEEGEAPDADGELTYTATDDDMDAIVQQLWNNKSQASHVGVVLAAGTRISCIPMANAHSLLQILCMLSSSICSRAKHGKDVCAQENDHRY
jgi:hypothetical protein